MQCHFPLCFFFFFCPKSYTLLGPETELVVGFKRITSTAFQLSRLWTPQGSCPWTISDNSFKSEWEALIEPHLLKLPFSEEHAVAPVGLGIRNRGSSGGSFSSSILYASFFRVRYSFVCSPPPPTHPH